MPRRASPEGPAGGLATRYAALLRGTGAAPALAFSLLGRLSLSTTGLALLLLVREHSGSYAAAGAVAASYAAAFAPSCRCWRPPPSRWARCWCCTA